MSTHDAKTLVHALLDVNVQSIIPLTADHVAKGCKVFGAAILRKSDLSLVIAGTNNEVVSPLLVSNASMYPRDSALWKRHNAILAMR